MKDQYWYQQSVFYEVSVQSFFDANGDGIGDLAGLTEKLDYFVHLGVNCLWLIPFFESPMRDGGYDISDYRRVNPNFGSIEDFETLVSEAHKRGLRIIIDLVMNHTSDALPWFQAARKDRHSKYHDYYVWSDTDQKYRDARIIFLDSEKSNWTWNEETQEYYWHRFYFHQPDLNYDNPAVLEEMLEIVDFWLAMGIDGFRVDAVPYLIEREGTNCENLPETHQILKRLRAFVEEKYTGRVLVCEANQWPRDVVKYLGEGDEFQVAFNFPLMPRIFMALKRADSSPIQWAMEQLPAIPENCQWGTFLRNHDELTLEMVTEEERQFMWVEYAEDRRQRLNLGIRRRLTPLLDNDRRKIELAHSLLFSLPGAPFLYYGDELGMGDNIELFDRNGLRTPMQWNEGRNAGFSTASQIVVPIIDTPEYPVSRINAAAAQADPTSTWHTIRRMVKLRKLNPVFSSHNFEWVNCHETRAVVFDRRSAHEGVLALHNLSSERVALTIPGSATSNSPYTDLFTGEVFETGEKGLSIVLTPYQYLWLKYRER
jgi:maltose alpha-D-glucosyltransferase/alpha-amylase